MDKRATVIGDEYLSSLADLNVNSKPLINMLTILADENLEHAAVIVKAVETHLAKVSSDVKLPILYLIDSIVKNVGKEYKTLFSQCIVNMFCGVFEKVNEKIREKMFNLRQTWNEVFPQPKLYTLDVKINCIDPGWPITAKVTTKSPAIHVNPNFFKNKANSEPITEMQQQLRNKQRELLELQAKKLELELVATKKRIEEQEKQIIIQTASVSSKEGTQETTTANKTAEVKKMAEALANSMPLPTSTSALKGRIAPVNPALISLAKSRDPRLARQQAQMQLKANNNTPNTIVPSTSINSVFSIKERIPRIMKTAESSQTTRRSKPSSSSSRSSNPLKSRSSENESKRMRREDASSGKEKDSTGKSTGNNKTSSRSNSNLEKKKLGNSISPTKSISPNKKKRDSADAKLSSRSSELGKSPSKFKDVRSVKNKNYMRRNRDASKSPEKITNPTPAATETLVLPSMDTGDVDLRVLYPEKKIKLDETQQQPPPQNNENDTNKFNTNEQKNIFEAASKDIDLRIVPTQIEISVNNSATASPAKDVPAKKRTSNSKIDEPNPKKTKSEKIDMLFGNEDVDLRTLGGVTAIIQNSVDILTPAPPPPPIISNKIEENVGAQLKNDTNENSTKSNLEAVRAKFAEATKKDKDKLGRPLLYNKLPDDPVERKRTISSSKVIDIDLRQRDATTYDESSGDGINTNIKIIMTQAQEQLDNDKIDADQYKTLVKQVIHMNEAQKIREAQRIESKSKTNVEKPSEVLVVSEDEVGFSSCEETDSKSVSDRKQVDRPTTVAVAPSAEEPVKVDSKHKFESAFASATAADLRNMQSSNRDPRRPRESKWNRPESQTSNSRLNQRANASNNSNFNNKTRGPLPNPWEQSPFQTPAEPSNNFNRFPQPLLGNGGIIIPGVANSNESMRTINIDGIAREIRFYGDIAVIFMSWDEPKDIGFQMGQRRVTVDDSDTFDLCFNEEYKGITIEKHVYQMKFGAPTRELYIDNVPYECYFGDPPISILLNGKPRVFKIGGPAPQVKIGSSRTDLVAGKINMIINAELIIPIFLDAKVQTFEIFGQPHTLQFADYLLTVLINDEPFLVEFGGLPKVYNLRGKDYYIRFTAAPKLIVPGKVYIKDMVKSNLQRDLKTPPLDPNSVGPFMHNMHNASSNSNKMAAVAARTETPATITTGLDYLTNLMPHSLQSDSSNNMSGYKIEDNNIPGIIPATALAPSLNIPLLNNINIDELYKKIVECGIISKTTPTDQTKDVEKKENIVPVSLSRPESIKKRQSSIVSQLFSGMQCSSCGVRFPPEQTMKYSQHLDWHFRQNRRDRDSARRAHSRKWYYDVSDWIQYEEIEDLEEREKNWFETQQTEQLEFNGEESNQRTVDTPPPSCPAGSEEADKKCDMCHDVFEQFYNEENEEWHLKAAVRFDGKTYHPLCYDDFTKASLTLDESALNVTDNTEESKSDDVKIKTEIESEADDTIKDISVGDDDDVIEMPTEAPVITEILDDEDEEMAKECAVEEETEPVMPVEKETEEEKPDDDPDVEIQEPNIEVTDLDDIEDKPASVSTMDETSQMSQSSLMIVKIKEEPKDDSYNEEDAFEDVGTVEPQDEFAKDNFEDVEYVASPTVDTTHSDMITSIDGNVELQDTPATSVTNKIKINITKSNKAIVNNCNENSSDISPPNLANNNFDELNNDEDESNNKDISIETEQVDISYDLKPSLAGVEFAKLKPMRNGFETSGLCSVM